MGGASEAELASMRVLDIIKAVGHLQKKPPLKTRTSAYFLPAYRPERLERPLRNAPADAAALAELRGQKVGVTLQRLPRAAAIPGFQAGLDPLDLLLSQSLSRERKAFWNL